MKKLSLSIMFLCCALTMAAQDAITVKFQGAKPTISDFITAYLQPTYGEDGEQDDEYRNGLRAAWNNHRKGVKQEEGVTFTLDVKNGFACYEYKHNDGENDQLSRVEMCYWNEADQKHKLFACSTWSYTNGKPGLGQYDGIVFFRYNNTTHKMSFIAPPGFNEEYDQVTYSLPRTGRDIVVNYWSTGVPKPKVLKFNGTKFSF